MPSPAQEPRTRRSRHSLSAVTFLVALVLCLPAAPAAQADFALCGTGSGAGQCENPQDVATNFATGTAYVADGANNRVDVFDAQTGDFEFAFGWGVADGSAEFQKCTTTCEAGKSGTGAGQFSNPRWIAVDNSSGSGDLYVSDNNRICRFEADGGLVFCLGWGVDAAEPKEELQTCTEVGGCLEGEAGLGECQLGGNRQPVAIGPGGNAFVVNSAQKAPNERVNRVQEYTPAGECVEQTTILEGDFRLKVLAVDEAGDAYTAVEGAGGELRKYALGTDESELCDLDDGINTNSVALDGKGHLLAGQNEPADEAPLAPFRVITEYDAEGCPPAGHVRRFGYGKLEENVVGVAAYPPAEEGVFAAEREAQALFQLFPSPGALVANVQEPVFVGNVRARVRAEINPEGKESEAIVEYVDDASFVADVEEGHDGFQGPGTGEADAEVPFEAGREFRANATEVLLGCEEASEEAIEDGECLTPETTYHWRVRGENADGEGEGPKAGQSFTTKEPVETEVFATGVSTDTATLNAVVNPLGIAATGYFEYVDESAYQASGFKEATKVPDVDGGEAEYDFGAGEAKVKRGASLYPLKPATTYRYRLSTQDLFYSGIHSEEKTFTTYPLPESAPCPNDSFRQGPAALLPDCRAHELVSPVDKQGGDIIAVGQELTGLPAVLEQSAEQGGKLAYGSYRAFGDAESGPYTSQYIGRRIAGDEWQSHAINPPGARRIRDEVVFDTELKALGPDLCDAWLVPFLEPIQAEGAVPGYFNLYRRSDQLCGGAPDYEALSTAAPESATVGKYDIEPQGLSADGEIAAFAASDSLAASGAPTAGEPKVRLYVKGPGGGPRFACVLPGGKGKSSEACSGGTGAESGFGRMRLANVTNALSGDGSRLYWTEGAAMGPIYLRENPLGAGAECAGEGAPCTVAVSEAGEEMSGSTASQFWAAARDGAAAIYSTGGKLSEGKADLYRYRAEGAATSKVAGQVYGFVGASEDAGAVYFASGEAISGAGQNSEGEEAAAGKPNLYRYLAQSESYEFIATLATPDVVLEPQGLEQSSATALEPIKRSSRVSGDGESAAFMSAAPLTGFDNTDVVSELACGESGGEGEEGEEGICDTEVFVYEAGSGELLCASCNPSGARPAGADVEEGNDKDFWVAARLGGAQTTLRYPQSLTPDGERLYFESQDPLVARDKNGRLDVYQWQRAGQGGCATELPTYSPEAGGCIDLLSSGQSAADTRFLDASADGKDVFFATAASLLPQDPGLVDIYDAREGGGLPVPPPPDPECEGEACQSPAPAPEPAAPGSSLYAGPGNLIAPGARSPRCSRPAKRARRLARRAKALRGSARQKHNPRAARKARRYARSARRLSRNAKRCRARVRAARRRGR